MAYFSEHSGEEIALAMVGVGGAVLGAAALITAGHANTRCTRLEGRMDDVESSVESLTDVCQASNARLSALQTNLALQKWAE